MNVLLQLEAKLISFLTLYAFFLRWQPCCMCSTILPIFVQLWDGRDGSYDDLARNSSIG